MRPFLNAFILTSLFVWSLSGIGCGSGISDFPDPPSVETKAASEVHRTGGTLHGSVNPNGDETQAWFEYGTDPSYSQITSPQSMGSGQEHAIVNQRLVDNLTPNSLYHYRLVAENSMGVAYGGDQTFTTEAVDPPGVTTEEPSVVTQSGCTFKGTINPNGAATIGWFEWGPSSNYDTATEKQPLGDGILDVPLNQPMTGLGPASLYHYRAVAKNEAGLIYGEDQVCITLDLTRTPPTVSTDAATNLGPTSATLQGTINPNGHETWGRFEWGLAPTYGNVTPEVPIGSGIDPLPYGLAISGLLPDTDYHYRAIGRGDGEGAGEDRVLRTPQDTTPPSATGGLVVTNKGDGLSLELRWNAAVDPESGVDHYVVLEDGSDIQNIDPNASCARPTTTSCIRQGRLEGFRSCYRVRAVNDFGILGDMSPESCEVPSHFGVSTYRVSVNSKGRQGTLKSEAPAVSADGRYVAFASEATNLVPTDSNGVTDIFLRDRLAQTTVRISVASDGTEGNGLSSSPAMSQDGRFITYHSEANNIVSNDTNGVSDIFVYDQIMKRTQRVSLGPGGIEADGGSGKVLAISDTGRYVAFSSVATNLVIDDLNDVEDVFIHDRDPDGNSIYDEGNGDTILVSQTAVGILADGSSHEPSISGEGRLIAYRSVATNLVAGDNNGVADVYVSDRINKTTKRISLDSSGSEGDGRSFGPSISSDGKVIAFTSESTNLVSSDTNNVADIFIHELSSGVTARVSVDSGGIEANRQSQRAVISDNGRYVAFSSDATNLIGNDTNGVRDVFVRDRIDDVTIRVSVTGVGEEANGPSDYPALSLYGRYLAFESTAQTLVVNDTNNASDIFVYNRGGTSITNGSSRGFTGPGNDVLIEGFTIEDGSESKTVLLKGHGPLLTQQGLPGALTDPNIELYTVSPTFLLARNEDWRLTDSLCNAPIILCRDSQGIIDTGLDPCIDGIPNCEEESALLVTLSSGMYGFILGGVSGETGRSLAVIDEIQGGGLPRIVSTSWRAWVGMGGEALMKAVTIKGVDPIRVLIVGRGPSLADPPYGLSGVLEDPMMELRLLVPGPNPVIAQSDNWQATDSLCDSPVIMCGDDQKIIATGLDPCQPNPGESSPPTNCNLEPALLLTLRPGLYGVILEGASGGTGIGQVIVSVLEE